MRRSFIPALVLALGSLGLTAPLAAAKAKRAPCSAAVAKRDLAGTNFKVQQTLKTGQYVAFRNEGTWVICDKKAGPKRRYRTYSFDLDGQSNVGVTAFSQAGRCFAVQLKPRGAGYPSVASVDMRNSKDARVGASINQIDTTAPGAAIVKVQLSSTCLLGIAARSADGSRGISLQPTITSGVTDRFKLSAASTDGDLRALKLSGDKVSWTDAGVSQSKIYEPKLPG